MDRRINNQGYVWEVFSEKVIFELRYNFAIKNIFFIILSLNIFLNSGFSLIKNINCSNILSQSSFLLLFFFYMQIIELRVTDQLFRKIQPQHSTKDHCRFNHPIYLYKPPVCPHYFLILGMHFIIGRAFSHILPSGSSPVAMQGIKSILSL